MEPLIFDKTELELILKAILVHKKYGVTGYEGVVDKISKHLNEAYPSPS